MSMKITFPSQFSLSLITLALSSSFAHANNVESTTETHDALPSVTVKGSDLSTHRIRTQKLDETTATDMKDVLFNEPSVSFGGGNGTSQWMTIRAWGRIRLTLK